MGTRIAARVSRNPRLPASGRFFLLALLIGACSGPPPRTANPTRPLDERRAIEIIISAFREEHDRPVPGRKVELTDGKQLEVDVGSEGKKYGVAYVTAGERMALGKALPPRDPAMGDALQLVRGERQETDARILVLHDTEYMYDDQVGTEHEASTITAERKLARDVSDFLVRAHAERWP